jgi:catechol 2,3-dioxygenase-like lactoylglutathione lyase family enzyme
MTGSWLVSGFDPIFMVADLPRSVEFYGRLGFESSLHDEAYAFAHREVGLTIHIAKVAGDERAGGGSLYLHCQDADRVADEWRARGIDVDGPRDEEYGRREGAVSDPDGNVIRFGSPIR